MKKLPIGIQSFSDLRNKDFLYVDKTEAVLRLIVSGKFYFLSRPRRFGKSLLLSTIEEVFKGNKSLFENLFIYDKWDWTQKYPVICIDWSNVKHSTTEEIEQSMPLFLKRIADAYKITLTSKYASDCFLELIEQLHQKSGEQVVVLIDEYDMPILDALNKSPEIVDDIRQSLQS
ncbi:MAG: AAA family ATPase, partial [Planctomycetaceae bacterium]|nr:AAA family ATPase [Planctomycetaceae bacterium]